jgi:hypothetical protein
MRVQAPSRGAVGVPQLRVVEDVPASAGAATAVCAVNPYQLVPQQDILALIPTFPYSNICSSKNRGRVVWLVVTRRAARQNRGPTLTGCQQQQTTSAAAVC